MKLSVPSWLESWFARPGKGVLRMVARRSFAPGAYENLPTAGTLFRGALTRTEGGAGIADTLVFGYKDGTDTYQWLDITTVAATSYGDEQAQDAIGTILADSATIDFAYSDATPSITAAIVTGSIDESHLDTSVNASLDLADSAVQNLSDLSITASASELNTLDGITSSTAELNALDGITATVTELNYTDGVTSAIQTQLDAKQPLDSDLTAIAGLSAAADRILFWDQSAGSYAHLVASTGLTISTTNMTVRTASASQTGIVELATTAETTTGTDTARAVTPDGLHDMTSLAGAAWFLDEDTMTSDSATQVASQQSIKAYADTKQPLASNLTAIAALTPGANDFIVSVLGTYQSRTPAQVIAHLGLDVDIATLALPASTTISAFGATLVDDADAATARATLDLELGVDVQAYSADLTDLIAAWTPASASGPASLQLAEDTDNGSFAIELKAPSAITAPRVIDFPDTNGTVALLSDIGTGGVSFYTAASSAAPANIHLHEDTDNGTNYVELSPQPSLTGDRLIILPDANGEIVLDTNTVNMTNKTLTSPTISGGAITGITDLALADGGTGASDALTARVNLGVGLDFIDSDTFSGVASHSTGSVFSADYEDYLIGVRLAQSDANTSLLMRLRVSGGDASGSNYYTGVGFVTSSVALANSGATAQSSFSLLPNWGAGITTTDMSFWLKLSSPFATAETVLEGSAGGRLSTPQSAGLFYGGHYNATTSYDAVTIITASGTITGTIAIYGIRN